MSDQKLTALVKKLKKKLNKFEQEAIQLEENRKKLQVRKEIKK